MLFICIAYTHTHAHTHTLILHVGLQDHETARELAMAKVSWNRTEAHGKVVAVLEEHMAEKRGEGGRQ